MDILQHKKNRCQKSKKRNGGKCILPLGITKCSLPCTYKSRKSEKQKGNTIYATSLLYLITDQHPIQINLQKGVSNITKAGNKKNEKFFVDISYYYFLG